MKIIEENDKLSGVIKYKNAFHLFNKTTTRLYPKSAYKRLTSVTLNRHCSSYVCTHCKRYILRIL